MNKYKTPIIIGVVVLGLVALLALPNLNNSQNSSVQQWEEAGVNCLSSNKQLAYHNHSDLTINLGNSSTTIPAGLGETGNCLAEIHTHDPDNRIHAEAHDPDEQLTLGQFFQVWGKKIDWPGYKLEKALVNGQNVGVENAKNIILKDGIDITLDYERISTSTKATSSGS